MPPISKEDRERVENMLDYPADTRPGANTSSLIIHSLATSAIASAIVMCSGGEDLDRRIAIIRLSSIFHDVGKFLMEKWHEHHVNSARFVSDTFNPYVDGEASKLIERASSIIKGEEKGDLAEILKISDIISSNVDRFSRYFEKLLRGSRSWKIIEDKLEGYKDFHEAYKSWDFWEKFDESEIVQISKEFCSALSSLSPENPIYEERGLNFEEGCVYLVKLDISGIQKYIQSRDIRSMNGASRIIDTLTYISVPLYLVEVIRVPAECILFFGGGSIYVLLPYNLLNRLEELVNHFKSEFGISIKYGCSPIINHNFTSNNFVSVYHDVESKMYKNKVALKGEFKVKPNIFKRCDLCGENFCTTKINDEFVCDDCRFKYNIGDEFHFRYRWGKLNFGDYDRVKDYMMEYLSGMEIDEIREGEEYKNLALLKFDGNLMGQFMASITSITDACERSYRIDMAIKRSLRSFIDKLELVNPGLAYRLILGLMYVGGDDGVLIVPASIAIPLALHIANEYFLEMGRKSTISIGIAVAKPKHPIYLLYECADELLAIAKKGARLDSLEVHSGTNKDFRGSIAFYSADGNVLDGNSLRSILRYEENARLSIQLRKPYTISNSMENSILKLIKLVSRIATIEDAVSRLIESLADPTFKEELKSVKRRLMTVLQVNEEPQIETRILFTVKESRRGESKIYEKMINFLVFKEKENGKIKLYYNLLDAYNLVKILEG